MDVSRLGHLHDWISYMVGALLVLGAKWWYWCATGRKAGTPIWKSTKQWFDVTRSQDQISWLTTIGIVWVGGYVYLAGSHLGWEWVEKLPVTMPFAFILGMAMECTAPAAFKWVLGKLPWGQADGQGQNLGQ